MTPDLDILSLLVDDADIAGWNNEGLPGDRMSIENATILTNCDRWPLMIDPQLQGFYFLLQIFQFQLGIYIDSYNSKNYSQSKASSGLKINMANH